MNRAMSIAAQLAALSWLALATALLADSTRADYPWPDNVLQYKGYEELSHPAGVHLFYWFFESRQDPAKDPLVVWLTGGPGCSSELALFLENGPMIINNTKEPTYNVYGWNEYANVLYIDQPVGTGFSYVDRPDEYANNETQIARDLLDFLVLFYAKYPKYSTSDLYVFGESYGGHYIPAFGQVLVSINSAYGKNFKGMAIGNGWTNPKVQYAQYAPFAFDNGLINQSTVDLVKPMYETCVELIESEMWDSAYEKCEMIPDLILKQAEDRLNRSINEYNIKQKCIPPPGCFDMTNLTNFLNRQDIKEELGVSKEWVPCSDTVYNNLISDWSMSVNKAVSAVLDSEIRVLVYSGKLDFVCNYYGGRAWTHITQWSGQEGFQNAAYRDWKVGGAVAGQVKAYRGLTLLEVNDASHQVPLSVPKAALDILYRFINNKPFAP